ncbi:hypothetical protein [Kitasatospora purpeofusca]|uniref:hypothetical protein n=1 Tax=Kitasatospora purpeofusca TaxID=67352 RepID=UPI0036D393F4
MSNDQHLLKVYSDRSYAHTTTVRHQGSTVAFAMDDRRRIVYSVLDLSRHDEAKGEADAAYWSQDPLPLRFPSEVARVGYALTGTVRMPVVKRGGRVEADTPERLDEQELDRFLSSTARLGAAVPFHVVSDGTHVYVLRQSVRADHPDAVFRLADGTGSSGDPARTDYSKQAGAKVAVVDATLLCDRFVLAGGELKPVLEVRYRRSRHKGRPDSAKDSLGAQDMEGRPFVEPTQPPCWRVLHRVTFVSRVLPDIPPADAPPLEKAMRQLDVESNYELVRRLDPYVKGAATGLSELAEATRTTLARELPELLPHADDVIGFLAQYYGVEA